MKKSNTVKIARIVLIVLFLAILVVAGVYLIHQRVTDQNYRESINAAEQYIEDGDFELAIVSYQRAIERNPKNTEAYIGLSELYEDQDDYTNAITVLQNGYRATGSRRLYLLLSDIQDRYQSILAQGTPDRSDVVNISDGQESEKAQVQQESSNIAWNAGFLDKLRSYNYGDYVRDYGAATLLQEDGYVVASYEEAGILCYYRNTVERSDLVDELRGEPTENAMPEKVRVTHLEILFNNFEGLIGNARLRSLIGSAVDMSEANGDPAVTFEYRELIFVIAADADGNISGSDSWNEIEIPNANSETDSESDTGSISGYVVNALGEPLVGIRISFTNLTDRSSKVDDIQTGAAGAFSAELIPGDYEITVHASEKDEKYIDETYRQTVTSDSNIVNIQIVIGIRSEGLLRVVLEWGATPTDLDSYLTGTCNGQNVNVYYGHSFSSGTGFEANLDVDDMNGYGPETVTFDGDLSNASLTYTVRDFLHTGTLGASGARVRIYWTDGSVFEETVPASAVNEWVVFTVDGGELRIVNSGL